MQTLAVRFQDDDKGEQPTPSEFSIQSEQDLQELRAGNRQAAFVIPVEHFKQLQEFKDAVTDRGRKNVHKGLKNYLLRQKKIPFIDGNYSGVDKVKTGIRMFLENAARLNEGNFYLIGVKADIFQKLYDEASDAVHVRGTVRRAPRVVKVPLSADYGKHKLYSLINRYKIPEGLAKTYLGEALDVKLVLQMIMHAAHSDLPVLVLGESGTGKEIVAQQIHNNRQIRSGPFVARNCSAIPPDLFESELFGHEKGAFTGAVERKIGACEQAGHGTLFLDEIGDMSLTHQSKILRTLNDGEFSRVGGIQPIKFHARVTAATNCDLSAMMSTNRFREDLYFRLRGLVIRTPALRSHSEDIPALAAHLWRKITDEKAQPLSRKVLRELASYPWPGNVRDLKWVLSNAKSFFGEAPRVDQIRALWLTEHELMGGRQLADPAVHPAGPLWVDHLNHLRQIQELINAVRENLSPLAQRRRPEDSAVATVRQAVQNRLDELDVLRHNQQRFKAKPLAGISSALSDLMGAMKLLHVLLQKDVEGAIKRRRPLEQEFKEMEAVITKAADKLMRMI
jgi:DNA-binding NtrC family response regulator